MKIKKIIKILNEAAEVWTKIDPKIGEGVLTAVFLIESYTMQSEGATRFSRDMIQATNSRMDTANARRDAALAEGDIRGAAWAKVEFDTLAELWKEFNKRSGGPSPKGGVSD